MQIIILSLARRVGGRQLSRALRRRGASLVILRELLKQ
jgi:hypothetical protein